MANLTCRVCGNALPDAVYRSPDARSVTSMCEFYAGPTEVYFCGRCAHLQTTEIGDLQTYYDTQYNILVDSDEEDSLYAVVDGRKIFRVEHQVQTLLGKVPLAQGARILDYGCAKSATTRKLLESRPDLQVHLFDVSSAYKRFWEKFVPEERTATYSVPAEWAGRFDAVLSFYALEHAADPAGFVRQLARLLKEGGHLHLLVPNVYANTADFVVVDHVNHFSAASLRHALESAGLAVLAIDDKAHDAAWVATAQKKAPGRAALPGRDEVASVKAAAEEMAAYWSGFAGRVRAFEAERARGRPAAVYGSGFYGTFITSCVSDLSAVGCFLDQNPYRHTKKLLGKPIVAPERIGPEIEVVYVGLNPRIARKTIEALEIMKAHPREFFYP